LALQGGDQNFLLSVMRSVLESSSIVKVFHDCRGDAQEFRDNLGLDLANIIDTQMMHAFVTVCQWSKCVLLYPANAPLGFVNDVHKYGFGSLTKVIGFVSCPFANAIYIMPRVSR
jgi:hypothetical protein